MAAKQVLITIALCGDPYVGKTGIFKKFIRDQFNSNEKTSVSCDVACKKLNVEGRSYNVQLWDTAGQEIFRSTTTTYFRNRHVMLFAYDITNKDTLQSIEEWIREFEQVQREPEKTLKFLIGCKKDLNSQRQVTVNSAKVFAKRNSLIPFECSAKTGEGITEIFTTAISMLQNGTGVQDLNPIEGINTITPSRVSTTRQSNTTNRTKQTTTSPIETEPTPTVSVAQPSAPSEEEEGGCC
ncbi:Rab6 [Entamoeba marina]